MRQKHSALSPSWTLLVCALAVAAAALLTSCASVSRLWDTGPQASGRPSTDGQESADGREEASAQSDQADREGQTGQRPLPTDAGPAPAGLPERLPIPWPDAEPGLPYDAPAEAARPPETQPVPWPGAQPEGPPAAPSEAARLPETLPIPWPDAEPEGPSAPSAPAAPAPQAAAGPEPASPPADTPPSGQQSASVRPAPGPDPIAVAPQAPPDGTTRQGYSNVLIAGDSFAGWGLGSTLEREIGKTGAQVSRFDKVSSGLCNPKFFDWNVNLKRLLAQTGAQAVILILGANDTHPMRDENGKGHSFGSEGWNEIYARRVRRLVDIAGEAGVDVFWMGLPIMGRKGAYNDEIRNVNAVASAACNRAPNCRFFDTYGLLADNAGAYRASLTTPDGRTKQLRAKDNVHLSMTGAEIMVSAFLKTASRWGFRRAPLPGSGARGPEPPAGSVRAAGAEVAPGPGGPPGARLPEGAIGTGEPAEPQAAPGAPAEPSQPGGRRAEAGGGLAMAG